MVYNSPSYHLTGVAMFSCALLSLGFDVTAVIKVYIMGAAQAPVFRCASTHYQRKALPMYSELSFRENVPDDGPSPKKRATVTGRAYGLCNPHLNLRGSGCGDGKRPSRHLQKLPSVTPMKYRHYTFINPGASCFGCRHPLV